MCGIVGIISQNKSFVTVENLKRMTDIIRYRGPDGDGQWTDQSGFIGLGHRRLSIIDLSTVASQPMHYMGRYTIVFNGEIYNYIEIKNFLASKGYKFTTESDTEVLIANFDYKREKCLDDFDGMFSFALWDSQEEILFCARDRFGEKPFFYHRSGATLCFGSEMKTLWAVGVPKTTNYRMLYNYWNFGYLNNPNDLSETFYKDIFSLEPSTYIIFNKNAEIVKKQQYWDINYKNQDEDADFNQSKIMFLDLFEKSVQRRLRSDVPVGSSLSGGLDSSSIVCAINEVKIGQQEQKTFSARFPNFIKDESKYIDEILKKVNAKGFSCFPTEESMLSNIDDIIYHQEEPFGTLSIAAQYQVMGLAAKNNVVVMLDGQGADEYLCGYTGLIDTYFIELKKKDKHQYARQREIYKKLHSDNKINSLRSRLFSNFVKENLSNYQINKLLGLKAIFDRKDSDLIKKDLFNQYKNEQFVKIYRSNNLNEMLYHDTMRGGLQELLRYADRNSMAHSLEVRLPFLFHEMVEFVFQLPSSFKVKNGYSKYILRSAMEEIVPRDILWRKDKIGYEPPNNKQIDGLSLKGYLVKSINL